MVTVDKKKVGEVSDFEKSFGGAVVQLPAESGEL